LHFELAVVMLPRVMADDGGMSPVELQQRPAVLADELAGGSPLMVRLVLCALGVLLVALFIAGVVVTRTPGNESTKTTPNAVTTTTGDTTTGAGSGNEAGSSKTTSTTSTEGGVSSEATENAPSEGVLLAVLGTGVLLILVGALYPRLATVKLPGGAELVLTPEESKQVEGHVAAAASPDASQADVFTATSVALQLARTRKLVTRQALDEPAIEQVASVALEASGLAGKSTKATSSAIGLRTEKTMAGRQAEPVMITIQNRSSVLNDEQAQAITEALNVQAMRDYNESSWVTDGHSQPIGKVQFVAKDAPVPDGTWHIELLDTSPQEGALGFHEDEVGDEPFKKGTRKGRPEKASEHSQRGRRADDPKIPLAKIFCKTTEEDEGQPSEVASHEMLEMLVDPQVVPDPATMTDQATRRIYPLEICDPVQRSGKEIDGVLVSNFVMPAYFKLLQPSEPTRYDWYKVLTLPVPAMTPGGYLSFAPIDEPENWQQEEGEQQK
jgi:hypothetical protein